MTQRKTQHQYPPDPQFLAMVDRLGPGKTAIKLGVSRGAVANRVRRLRASKADLETPGLTTNTDGTATVVTPADLPKAWSPDEILRDSGLNPDDYLVRQVRVNRWGPLEDPKYQVRVDVAPESGVIKVPDPARWKPPKPRKRTKKRTGQQVGFVVGDHHAPHHEPVLHELFLQAVAETEPDFIEFNGDLLDFSTLSRHRESISGDYNESVSDCLEAGFRILADIRSVAPADCRMRLKRGNHDERLQTAVIDAQIGELRHLTAANEDVPVLSLRNLLHLDALDVDYVDEDWSLAKTRLTPKLSVRHGTSTSKNAGEELLNRLGGSAIQGHTHRLSARYRLEWHEDEEEPYSLRTAWEGGTMATIPGGLGYVPSGEPQWANGFLVVHTYDDGRFTVAPAVYVPNCLLMPDGHRYDA